MPLGACSLCAGKRQEIHAQFLAHQSSVCPAPAPRRCGTARPCCGRCAAISSTGKSTPVSLFAHMTETIAVSGRMDCSSRPRSNAPSGSTGRKVTVAALLLEKAAEFDGGRMLNGGREHVPFSRVGGQGAVQGGVVALGAATGEDNLPRLGIDERGHPGRAPRQCAGRPDARRNRRWRDCPNAPSGTAASPPALRARPGWWRCYQSNRASVGS